MAETGGAEADRGRLVSAPEEFDVASFRALTARVIADEKPGFRSDWTEEQRALYRAGDWRGFSTSRGYTAEAIAGYGAWRDAIQRAQHLGLNTYAYIADLTTAAARANLALDTKDEILLSSHLPFEPRERVSSVFGGGTFDELERR